MLTIRRNSAAETTTYAYYPPGVTGTQRQLHTVTGPGGALLQTLTYDAWGRLATMTDADGYTVRMAYDAFDRPLYRFYPDGTYEQTIDNWLDAEWQRDRQGRWTRTEHDARQAVTGVTDLAGRRTQFDWCECGALDAITDAENQTTTFLRDVQARVTDKVYADGTALKYVFETRTSRLKEMRQPRTATFTAVTNYEYWIDDALKKVRYTDGAGASLETRRADGTKVDVPVEWTCDLIYRRVATMTDGTGTTSYAYHPLPNAPNLLGFGRLGSIGFQPIAGQSGAHTLTYGYDEYGRVVNRQIDGTANPVTRTYEPLGRVATETNPLGAFAYAYAGNTGRLAEVSNGQGFRTSYEYYPNLPATPGTGNGDHRLKAIQHYPHLNVLDAEHDYGYTPAGNITQWTQRWDSLADGADYKLRYDAADQLIGAERRNTATSVLEREDGWGYDPAGNRELTQSSVREAQGSYQVKLTRDSHNTLNQLTSRTGGSGALRFEGTVNELATVQLDGQHASVRPNPDGAGYRWSQERTLAPGANSIAITATDAGGNATSKTANISATGTAIPALTYDLAGNQLSDGARTCAWDAANRLVQITYAGTNNRTEFTYDGLSRRVRSKEIANNAITSDARHVWEGLSLAEDRDAATHAARVRYFGQGEAQTSGAVSDKHLYQRDHLGSVRALVDEAGAVRTRYDYGLYRERTAKGSRALQFVKTSYAQQYFYSASETLPVGAGDELIAYVWLDPANPPSVAAGNVIICNLLNGLH